MANYPNYVWNVSNSTLMSYLLHIYLKAITPANWAVIIVSTTGINCTLWYCANIFYKALFKLFLLFIPFYNQYLEYFYFTFYLYLNNSALASLSHWRLDESHFHLFLASVAFVNFFLWTEFVCMDAIYEDSCKYLYCTSFWFYQMMIHSLGGFW